VRLTRGALAPFISKVAGVQQNWVRLARGAPAPFAGMVDAHELIARMSPLQKGYFTAEAQRSRKKMPYRVAQMHASPRIHFVFEVLCALGVLAVHFCSEVVYAMPE